RAPGARPARCPPRSSPRCATAAAPSPSYRTHDELPRDPARGPHPTLGGGARPAVGRAGDRVDRRTVHRVAAAPHPPAAPGRRVPRRRPLGGGRRPPTAFPGPRLLPGGGG